jgi:hypothetical protein
MDQSDNKSATPRTLASTPRTARSVLQHELPLDLQELRRTIEQDDPPRTKTPRKLDPLKAEKVGCDWREHHLSMRHCLAGSRTH